MYLDNEALSSPEKELPHSNNNENLASLFMDDFSSAQAAFKSVLHDRQLQGDCCFKLKSIPEDFVVHERMGFEPSGSGEHCILSVEKKNLSTKQMLRHLAKTYGVPQHSVGYSGLKDKVAVTTQWVSVTTPVKQDRDWLAANTDQISVRFLGRHQQKLRPGTHESNCFSIVLRDFEGDQDQAGATLRDLKNGYPNVFGGQRFGRGLSNLRQFAGWKLGLSKKIKRAAKQMMISSVRSAAFNLMVLERYTQGLLRTVEVGDYLMWKGSRAIYQVEASSLEQSQQRLDEGELDVAFPLVDEEALWKAWLEKGDWLSAIRQVCDEKATSGQWRRIWVVPEGLAWQWSDKHLALEFALPPGAYATQLVACLGSPSS